MSTIARIEELERAGDFDRAFHEMEERNRLDVGTTDLDSLARLEELRYEQYARSFSASALAAAASGNGSAAPIFIIGMPRSGSSLVEQILDSHPDVTGLGETVVLGVQYFERLSWLQPELVGASEVRGVAVGYLREMRRRGWSRTRRFSDKSLGNYELVAAIHMLFPRATILHCVRDPLDTCFACFRQPFNVKGATFFTRDLAHMGGHYIRYRRLMDHWSEVMPGRVVDVFYEPLVADLDTQVRRLLKACGLEWNQKCLRFYENTREVVTASRDQVRRPVFTNSIGRWRPYQRRLGPLIDALGPYAHAGAEKVFVETAR